MVYKKHICFGQTPKGSSKVLFRLDFFFHGTLYCCVRYSNIEYQDEIFKTIIKSTAQKVMANYCFGHRVHDLQYFEVGISFFIFLEFIINLRVPL